MNQENRPRWTRSNAGELYISYFELLNSYSGVEYFEMIYEENLYHELYYEIYKEKDVCEGIEDIQLTTKETTE